MKNIKVELSSNLDYEGMVIYLSIEDQEIAILNYDKGVDNLEVELLPLLPEQDKFELPLDELMNALQQAKEILLECAEQDKTQETF